MSSSIEEIALEPGSLVIADLHLDVEDRVSTAPFLKWLARARGAPRLIVLGDLFEFWIGPAQIHSETAQELLGAIRDLVVSGTDVDVVPGNRDFLLDVHFERASSAQVRHDGLIGRTPAGNRVLFLHGDELSTLDLGHQRLRRVLRSRPIRWLAPRLPRSLAFCIARRLRRASRRATRGKDPAVMAMQSGAVRALAEDQEAQTLVCGHGHSCRDEPVGDGLRWLVVDAFGGKRDTLILEEGGFAWEGSAWGPAPGPGQGAP